MSTEPVPVAQIPTANPTAVQEYVLGGRSTFTVVSNKTQARYTYRVRIATVRARSKSETIEEYRARKALALAGPRTVEAMTGSDNYADYTPIGTILPNGVFVARREVPSKVEGRRNGFAWFWKAVVTSQDKLSQTEVWHDGHCSCCGKKLTVPESLSTGRGPICAGIRYNPAGLQTHLGN